MNYSYLVEIMINKLGLDDVFSFYNNADDNDNFI
jgi:hypothetical protein